MINMEKLASIGTLAAGVAHEINNPMTVILGFTEHLLEQTESMPEIHETLQVIEDEGLRCKKIVENILTFARMPQVSETTAEVTGLLEKTLAVVKNTLLTKKIRLETSLAPSLPRVKGDPPELQQVFINLVNNAADAMGWRGLKVHQLPRWQPWPSNSPTRVRHPPGSQPKSSTSSPPRRPAKAPAWVHEYGIITKFGGNIIFTSHPADEYPEKHGTTFTVYLPIISGLEAEAAGQEQAAPEQPQNA
jgi:signal transduction histidine kinase